MQQRARAAFESEASLLSAHHASVDSLAKAAVRPVLPRGLPHETPRLLPPPPPSATLGALMPPPSDEAPLHRRTLRGLGKLQSSRPPHRLPPSDALTRSAEALALQAYESPHPAGERRLQGPPASGVLPFPSLGTTHASSSPRPPRGLTRSVSAAAALPHLEPPPSFHEMVGEIDEYLARLPDARNRLIVQDL